MTCDNKTEVIAASDQGFSVHKQAKDALHLSIIESVTIRQLKPNLSCQKDRLFLLRLG